MQIKVHINMTYQYLCIRLERVSDRCAVARCVSRRRGNTGRQRQVVPWWRSATSQRLRLDDLSETELTAALWVSARFADTCWRPRHVRPTESSTPSTANEVLRLRKPRVKKHTVKMKHKDHLIASHLMVSIEQSVGGVYGQTTFFNYRPTANCFTFTPSKSTPLNADRNIRHQDLLMYSIS